MQAQAQQQYAAGTSPDGDAATAGAAAAVNPPEEITKVAEDFCARYPVDANAMDYLLTSTPEVQARVVQEFRPSREGEGDYSALLTAFVKRCRGDFRGTTHHSQVGGATTTAPVPGSTVMGANGQMLQLSASGVYEVVHQQAQKPSHTGSYGGRQESRFGGAGAGLPVEQPLPGTLDAFVMRYPVDERALDYFSGQRPEVQERVLREFRPPREGDNDYSMIFMSFVKRCRGDAKGDGKGFAGAPASAPAASPRPLVFATPAPLLQQQHQQAQGGAYTTPAAAAPVAGSLDALAARYPLDERAFDYFSTCPPDVQEKVLQEFRPRTEGEADYSQLFMAFVKRCRQGSRQDQLYQPPAYAQQQPQQQPQMQQNQGSFNGGSGCGGTGAVLGPGPEGLEAFRQRFPMDDRAMAYLTESTDEVRERVLNTFVPPRPDDLDFSAPVTAYVTACRRLLDASAGGGGGAYQAAQPALQPAADPGYNALAGAQGATPGAVSDEINAFVQRYPIDARAIDYLSSSSATVQGRVIREFAPKQEGEADYSLLVMAFIKRIKNEERGGGFAAGGGVYQQPSQQLAGGALGAAPGAPSPELSNFMARYPIDARAVDYLSTCSATVQNRVMSEFRPRQEGEADYSMLVMAFIKRVKNEEFSGGGAYQGLQPAGGGTIGGAPGAAPGATSEELSAFIQRYPIDARAVDYLSTCYPTVQGRVIREFRPRQEGEADYSMLVMAFIKRVKNEERGVGGFAGGFQAGQPFQQPAVGGAPGAAPGVAAADLNAFLGRYPVDERALDYLNSCSPSVQSRVVREFRPKQEGDSDYSPLVMAFIKRIKSDERGGGFIPGGFAGAGTFAEPPWKRPRAF